MEINRLLSDEITYELLIRGLPTDGTVAAKRTVLRDAFRIERTGVSNPPVRVRLDAMSELSICNDKLGDLQEDINNFHQGNAQNEFKRISTRLTHILLRLERLQPNESQEEQRSRLATWCKRLLDAVRNKIMEPVLDEPPPRHLSQSLIDEPNLLIPEIVIQSASLRQDDDIGYEQTERPIGSDSEEAEIPNLVNRHDTRLPNHSRERVGTSRFTVPYNTNSIEGVPHQVEINHLQRTNTVRFQEPIHEPPFHSTRHESYNYPEVNRRTTYTVPNQHTEGYSQRVNSTMDLSTQMRHLQFSPHQLHQNSDMYCTTPVSDRCDIYRWGIKYDGQSSLATFLERLEEIRQSRGVSKERLLQSAVELFEKDALLWFRMNEFSSWEDLVGKLRSAFQPYDYENALWDEIRRRTQGAHERVISYVSVMESLFRRLKTKPFETERVDIIKRNMLPYIQTQMALQPIEGLQDLIKIARTIEETDVRVQKFCPPPTSSRNLMEPELAYKSKHQTYANTAPVNVGITPNIDKSNEKPLCWNCGDGSHKFKKCQKPKKIFCFKCGKSDVTCLKCPDCSSKNPKARQ